MRSLVTLVSFSAAVAAGGDAAAQRPPRTFTHADTLRGSNGPGRAWWDATFYDLHVAVSPADSSIRGWNAITYRVLKPSAEMQIDLQVPLEVDSMVQERQARHVSARRQRVLRRARRVAGRGRVGRR